MIRHLLYCSLFLTCKRVSSAHVRGVHYPAAALSEGRNQLKACPQSTCHQSLARFTSNKTGCGLSWVLLMGDSVTRGTFYSLATALDAHYPESQRTEVGQADVPGRDTHWRDVDIEYGNDFKLSLRFMTNLHAKLPAVLANFSMLHGGHNTQVQPLPDLARPGPAFPDVVFFSPGLWPLVASSEAELAVSLEHAWKQLAEAVPKFRLHLVNLPEVTKQFPLTSPKWMLSTRWCIATH